MWLIERLNCWIRGYHFMWWSGDGENFRGKCAKCDKVVRGKR